MELTVTWCWRSGLWMTWPRHWGWKGAVISILKLNEVEEPLRLKSMCRTGILRGGISKHLYNENVKYLNFHCPVVRLKVYRRAMLSVEVRVDHCSSWSSTRGEVDSGWVMEVMDFSQSRFVNSWLSRGLGSWEPSLLCWKKVLLCCFFSSFSKRFYPPWLHFHIF